MSQYPRELVAPMAKDLTDYGFEALESAAAVDEKIQNNEGTLLVVVNSVCGCAAANARPGVKLAMGNDKTPENITTVFAGVDVEATAKAREYMLPYPPSSPSIALFKGNDVVFMVERHQIEGRTAFAIADDLKEAFNKYC